MDNPPPPADTEASPANAAAPGGAFDLPPSDRDLHRALMLSIAFVVFYMVTVRLPFSSIAIVVVTTIVSLALLLLVNVTSARALFTKQRLLTSLVVSATLAAPLILPPILFALAPGWSGWPRVIPFLRAYLPAVRSLPGLDTLLILWLATSVGVAVSRLLREIQLLLPAALALAFVDVWVVFGGGLVKQAETGRSRVAQAAMANLTVKLPTMHPHGGAAPMQLAVGFADLLFIAMFFASFARFGIPATRTFVALTLVLIGYMAAVAQFGVSLPALVPIAVVVIGMNLRRFRYQRSELFAMLYAGIIVAVVAGVFAVLHARR